MGKIIDTLQIVVTIFLIIFGIFVIYQLIIKILGSSWNAENIIVSLLMVNIGFSFTIAMTSANLYSDHNYLKHQFRSLAKDFKSHIQYS